MAPEDLGRFIEQARKRAGLTFRALAQESGLDHTYIAKLEKGEIALPHPAKLQKLVKALDIDLEDLYALADYPIPRGVPNLPAYLRTQYDLPPEMAPRVEKYLKRLRREQEDES